MNDTTCEMIDKKVNGKTIKVRQINLNNRIMVGAAVGVAKAGSIGVVGFIIKHWYIFMLLIFIVPSIITSFSVAKETNNPSYPVVQLGLMFIDADANIDHTIDLLRNEPENLVGMPKPTTDAGFFTRFKYKWLFFWKVIFKILGQIWFISFPAVLIYKLLRTRNTSEPFKNLIFSILFASILMLIVNGAILIVRGAPKDRKSVV